MFFFAKCVFWLSLVFYCMSWPGGERPDGLARQAAGEIVQRAQTAALDSALSACRNDPAGCLAMAGDARHAKPAGARSALRGSIVE